MLENIKSQINAVCFYPKKRRAVLALKVNRKEKKLKKSTAINELEYREENK